jgi:hypothetical protein
MNEVIQQLRILLNDTLRNVDRPDVKTKEDAMGWTCSFYGRDKFKSFGLKYVLESAKLKDQNVIELRY